MSDHLAAKPGARRKPVYQPQDPLLTARESAAECGRAISTFHRDRRSGVIPAPCVMVGRSPRWRRSILRAALGLAPQQKLAQVPIGGSPSRGVKPQQAAA